MLRPHERNFKDPRYAPRWPHLARTFRNMPLGCSGRTLGPRTSMRMCEMCEMCAQLMYICLATPVPPTRVSESDAQFKMTRDSDPRTSFEPSVLAAFEKSPDSIRPILVVSTPPRPEKKKETPTQKGIRGVRGKGGAGPGSVGERVLRPGRLVLRVVHRALNCAVCKAVCRSDVSKW